MAGFDERDEWCDPIGDVGRPMPWPLVPYKAAMLEHLHAMLALASDEAHDVPLVIIERLRELERLLGG